MAFKNILFLFIVTVLISSKIFAQNNTSPVVSNVAFSISGTTVTVAYDVYDAEQGTVTVDMQVSNDGGITWAYDYGTANGDIGLVTTGTGKIITWTYTDGYAENFKIKIIANDKTVGGTSCGKVYYEGGPNDDNDGKGVYYNTIQIGNQCWLKENLNIGVMIDVTERANDNATIEKYCQGNDIDTCKKYGGLYQWNEAVQYDTTTPGVQGICPDGWHIPTLTEYEMLINTIIATERYSDGQSLKAIGVGLDCFDPLQHGSGTNTSGFSSLLGGTRFFGGNFNSFNTPDSSDFAYYWSSTLNPDDPDHVNNLPRPYEIDIHTLGNHIHIGYFMRFSGFSVRCIRD